MGFNPGTGSESSTIAGSSDVSLSSPQDNQVLTYEDGSAKWQNQAPPGSSPALENMPAGSTISRVYSGSAWPARGTSRTDITVWWIDDSGSAPTPPELVVSADFIIVPSEVVVTSAAFATWGFEDQTHNTELVPPTGWTNSGTPSFVAHSAAATHGTLGARLPDISGYRVVDYSGSELTNGNLVVDFYFILRTVAQNIQIGNIRDSGGQFLANWRIHPDMTVDIRSALTAVDSSSTTLSIGVTYRAAWLLAGSTQELRIYQAESSTPIITLSGARPTGAIDQVRIGSAVASVGSAIDIDTIRLAHDWLSPAGA